MHLPLVEEPAVTEEHLELCRWPVSDEANVSEPGLGSRVSIDRGCGVERELNLREVDVMCPTSHRDSDDVILDLGVGSSPSSSANVQSASVYSHLSRSAPR